MWVDGLVWLTGTGIVILTTLVQNLSSKYKPWSWLAKQFGEAVNKEMLDKLDIISKKVEDLEAVDKRQDEEHDKQLALEARRRIIRFADECRRHEKHSEEYFNNVLEDISMYKDYCNKHPLFENEKAVIAISFIEDIYKYCYENDDFL